MPDWTAFGAVAGFVLVLVLGLARASAAMVDDDAGSDTSSDPGQAPVATRDDRSAGRSVDEPTAAEPRAAASEAAVRVGHDEGATDAVDGTEVGGDAAGEDAAREASTVASDRGERLEAESVADGTERTVELGSVSTPALLANVVVTHGVLAIVLVGAAGLTDVPASAFGAVETSTSAAVGAAAFGTALGGVLAVANAGLAANLDHLGLPSSDALRGALAPDSAAGWILLLSVILPIVAVFEELLFRAVLIGAAATATGVSPWPLVVVSSVLFALGHGIQGRGGVLVTGLLGGVLGVAFVLSGSLLLVVVAHYVVNVVEFVVAEYFDVDLRRVLSV